MAIVAGWNLVTWVLVAMFAGGASQAKSPFMALFISFLLLVAVAGAAGMIVALRSMALEARAGVTVVEVSANPLTPGERCQVFVSQMFHTEPGSLQVSLVCEERVTYRELSDTRTETRRVRRQDCFRGDVPPGPAGTSFETTFELEVPADAMHSLRFESNEITWLLEVEVGLAARTTLRRAYDIVINPPPVPGTSS